MEFETLTRRELQGLCKKNKIPANITNVAMIEALNALSFVEGLDELMQQSPGQRAAAKQEPETAGPLTRTRRTTRKTVAKDAVEGAMETPAVVQTTTRRARVTSVCRKMDAELKECEEEDKKKVVVETPAPYGVTTRRRRGVKEETTVVKREYSTRRSVRLAEKVEEVVDVVKNETSDVCKTELFDKDGEYVNVNVEECLDTLEEVSGITGTEVNSTLEEQSGEMDEWEVVSVQNVAAAVVENLDVKDESESIPVQEQHIQTVEETEIATTLEEESNQMSEVDDQKLDVEQIPSKAMDVDVGEENQEGHDESENVSVKEMCEDDDMDFAVNEEKLTDQVYQVTDDSKIEQSSEVSLMNEADGGSATAESFEGSDSVLNLPTRLTPFKEVYVRKATSAHNAITLVTDDSEIEQSSEVSLMNEADGESATAESFEGSDSVLNFEPARLTPFKEVYVRKATSAQNAMTAVVTTDNKENFGNETNVVPNNGTVKIADKAKELNELSVRQLTKMLKEKLEITSKKVPQKENAIEVRGRPALQILPENQMVDDGRN